MHVSPEAIAATIKRSFAACSNEFVVFWVTVADDRDSYAKALQEEISDVPIAVLVLRGPGFENADSVMTDLVLLLEQNRDLARGRFDAHPRAGKLGVVILSRRELRIGQASSPIVWPDWIPSVGGRQGHCSIIDVTWGGEVSLDSMDVPVSDLRRSLHSLERGLLRRLITTHNADAASHNNIAALLHRRADPPWGGVLAHAWKKVNDRRAESFRPSARSGEHMVSRIWAYTCANGKRDALIEHLQEALGVANHVPGIWRPSLAHTLTTSLPPEAADSVVLIDNLTVTVHAACQYITKAAHADSVPLYPAPLLQYWVRDIRQAMSEIEEQLIVMPIEEARPLV